MFTPVIIHADTDAIARVKASGDMESCLAIHDATGTRAANEISIYDFDGRHVVSIMFRPDAPLSCGATMWMEVDGGRAVVTHRPVRTHIHVEEDTNDPDGMFHSSGHEHGCSGCGSHETHA
jgi:hypothetical protein